MRRLICALAAIVASLAICASAALATGNEFVASKVGGTGEFALKGASGTGDEQVFDLAPFTVICAKSHSRGALSEQVNVSQSGTGFRVLEDTVTPSTCAAELAVEGHELSFPARFATALQLRYFGEISEPSISAPVTIEVRPLHCTIEIEPGERFSETRIFAGEVITTTKLHAFPSGFQRKLKLHNDMIELPYSFGGNCASLPSGAFGIYEGAFSLEVPNGNVEFLPPEEPGWNIGKNTQG